VKAWQGSLCLTSCSILRILHCERIAMVRRGSGSMGSDSGHDADRQEPQCLPAPCMIIDDSMTWEQLLEVAAAAISPAVDTSSDLADSESLERDGVISPDEHAASDVSGDAFIREADGCSIECTSRLAHVAGARASGRLVVIANDTAGQRHTPVAPWHRHDLPPPHRQPNQLPPLGFLQAWAADDGTTMRFKRTFFSTCNKSGRPAYGFIHSEEFPVLCG